MTKISPPLALVISTLTVKLQICLVLPKERTVTFMVAGLAVPGPSNVVKSPTYTVFFAKSVMSLVMRDEGGVAKK